MGISILLAVAFGGAVGAVGRYTLSTWIQGALGGSFPWGTLGVNVVGSFLMGVLVAAVQRGSLPPEFQTLAAVGILGSFTTFSAFSLETVSLLQEGAWARGVSYVAASVLVGLAAIITGMWIMGRSPA